MMTIAEAMNRLRVSHMGIKRFGGPNWQVFFFEDRNRDKENTYVTDDLEDAVINGGKMRLARNAAI